jgi:protease-4
MMNYFGWLARFLTKVVILFLALFMFIGALSALPAILGDELRAGSASGNQYVAHLKLEGVITGEQDFLRQLREELSLEQVIGAVVQIDSPGGAVGPSQELYQEIARLAKRKPVVAAMGSVAASGGLYASLGASRVFAQPGTLTGSIGVIMTLPNFEELSDRIGVGMTVIKSGALKDAGNSFRSMTETERLYFENIAETAHERFIQDIAEARKLDAEVVRGFADGRILLGEQALTLGLVDELGGMQDAARAVYKLAGEELAADKDPELRKKEDPFAEFRRIFSARISSWLFQPSHSELHYLMH